MQVKKQCPALVILLFAVSLEGASHAWAQGESDHLLIHVSFMDATLTLHAPDSTAIAEFPVVIPKPKYHHKYPIEGVVRSVIRDPWWYPTDNTRAAYFKNHGVELPEKIPPGDPQNAMGIGKIVIDFTTPGANPSVRIHGTNNPGIVDGPPETRAVSRGCIRLLNEDWLALAALISGRETHVLLN